MSTPIPPQTKNIPSRHDQAAGRAAFPGWRTLLVAVVACGAMTLWLRWQDARASEPLPPDALSTPSVPTWPGMLDQTAQVTTEVKAMKLITTEVRTRITSVSEDSSVLGAVKATVTAPVRLLYGVDLESLDTGAVVFSPLHRVYLVKAPPPTRLAAEVLSQFEDATVTTGWMRDRKSAGEYHLGLARRDLTLRAQQAGLNAEQRLSIREQARERIVEMVRKVVGEGAAVQVRFTDEVGGVGS